MFLNKFEFEVSLIRQKSIIIYAKRKRFEVFFYENVYILGKYIIHAYEFLEHVKKMSI